MSQSVLVQQLIEALQIMPGIGPVSATRIAYSLLDRGREAGLHLAQCVKEAMEGVSQCPRCRDYSDHGELCPLCSSVKRAADGLLCIVETPADLRALESAGCYGGRYFVLHGRLSPIDGLGPAELGLDELESLLAEPELREVILALSQTVEGEATAQYIAAMARPHNLTVSRLATGIPAGGDLMSADGNTLASSLSFRRPV